MLELTKLNLINLLSNLAAKAELPHAMLFSSDHNKCLNLAIALSQSLLCQNNWAEKKNECNCASCCLFESNSHPDFYIINLEETVEIKIDQIREVTQFARTIPYVAKRKVLLINHAHNLNLAASNAFLKSLEELEQVEVIFLLITNNYRLLPSTILSRVVRLYYDSHSMRLDKPNRQENLCIDSVLQDLHNYWVTSKVNLNDLVTAWLKISKKQLLDCLWLIITQMLKYENNKLIHDLNTKISPDITWLLFDSLNYINKLIVLKVPINWQLFLYNFLLTNITGENIYGARARS